jgi:hypothetical protein
VPSYLKVIVALVAAVLWFALALAKNEPRVEIRHQGGFATDPADWPLTIVVEPHADNRLLVLEVDGQPGEYRRSDYALEGDKAARLRQVWIKQLRAGCYMFVASIYGQERELAVARAGPVHVLGGFEGDPCGG